MVDKNIKLEKIDINSLVPADYNPRKISEKDYENLKRSIDEFGIVDPIIVNLNDNTIISGHQRFDVLFYENNLQELNMIKLGDVGWVFTDTDLKIKDKNHEKTLNLALNRIHGEFDPEKLNEVLVELEELHLDHLTGFDLELDNITYDFIDRIEDDDEEIYEDEDIDISEEEFYDYIDDDFDEIDEEETEIEDDFVIDSKDNKPNERIKRGFIKYGDVYLVGDSLLLMFGNENNGQDRSKLLKYNPNLKNKLEIPNGLKLIKTISNEINYYISNDAELIETFLIENKNICKKVQ